MNIEFDEQELWIAVIRQALQDATSLTLDPALVREARDWFTVRNDNFNEVCELAGKCPVRTSKGALLLIAKHDAKPKAIRPCKNVTLYTFEGQTLSLRQWGEIKGISHNLIYQRLLIGWTLERALSHRPSKELKLLAQRYGPRNPKTYTHEGQTLTTGQWAELKGINRNRLVARLAAGWTIERAISEPKRGQAPGVVSDLAGTLRDRRGSIAQPFPETEFFKIEELTE